MTTRPDAGRGRGPEDRFVPGDDPLVTENLGLVYDLATKLQRRGGLGPEREDLVSAGVRGLIQAAHGFDPERGLSFSTFAVARIRGAMLDELRRWDRIPRSVRKKERVIKASEAELRARLGREPTQLEVAAEIAIPAEELHGWYLDLARLHEEPIESADPTHFYEADLRSGGGASDAAGDVIHRLGRQESVGILERCMHELPERDQRVLALYYFEELRLREIAQLLGVTESRVSQIRHAALSKLRSLLLQHGVDHP